MREIKLKGIEIADSSWDQINMENDIIDVFVETDTDCDYNVEVGGNKIYRRIHGYGPTELFFRRLPIYHCKKINERNC
jgi:hypothetical protein